VRDNFGRLGAIALLSYPKAWRSLNGAVLLSTLSEVAEGEGRTAPRASQLFNVALTGLAHRAALVISAQSRDAISTVAFGSGAAFALVFLVVNTWSPWAAVEKFTASAYPHFGPFLNLGVIVYTLWGIALILLFAHKSGAARIVLAIAFFVSIAISAVNLVVVNLWMGPSITTLGFLAALSFLALVGRPRSSRGLALVIAFTLCELTLVYKLEHLFASYYVADQSFWSAAPGWSVISLVTIGVIASIVLGIARRRQLAFLVLLSTGVWALVFLAGSLRADSANTLALSGFVLVVALLGYAARIAVRRFHEPAEDRAAAHPKI
jgi:hypothetical protein